MKLNKVVNKGLVTVKPCQSRLKFSFASLLGALPCCWRKFVKSNARPSGLYTLLPRNFFGKITNKKIDGRLRTRQLKGAEKPARCPESNLSHLKKIVIKMMTEWFQTTLIFHNAIELALRCIILDISKKLFIFIY